MVDITDIDELGALDLEAKRIKKILDSGKAEIKASGKKEIQGKSFVAKVSERASTKINEEKALKVVRDNEITWLLKEVVDLDKLEDAIISGEVESELFKDCISEDVVKAVSFKKMKG